MRKVTKSELNGKKVFSALLSFVITFLSFSVITTAQFFIIGEYIDYTSIKKIHFLLILFFWVLCSGIFTYLTLYQIKQKYEKPMRDFAKATNQVANGDFSVYVEPLHSPDKMDYLDNMFLDFNKMVEELGSIETLKTDFVSNVSHEIKTPIAVIQNYAEYLQKVSISEEQRIEYAKAVEYASKRLSNLITNILKLNKIENQKIQLEVSQFDICRQLSKCAIQFEEAWDKKNIEFEADLEDRAMIYGDESLMELVWNNLLSNAIKFTENEGKITLKQTSTEDNIIVSVSDTGCGMSEDTLKHIFDKFYQGDTSHSMEGNGLGLALTLRVLQLHEGRIDAESILGKGTTFMVTIPVHIVDNIEDEEIFS
ncbi:HAMP domain-containing sensor histidine kinase [Sporosalibacterium faouarense]|uniref:HAMP domain-containing sensor histidine kinase n=1 Tax=Sporosalibacterium faouarense TaxID=516123 RepID=UPI00192C125C|nr:HAMP domain-containing sensor histidine kinase [Sporosalibacterium faouarense]